MLRTLGGRWVERSGGYMQCREGHLPQGCENEAKWGWFDNFSCTILTADLGDWTDRFLGKGPAVLL